MQRQGKTWMTLRGIKLQAYPQCLQISLHPYEKHHINRLAGFRKYLNLLSSFLLLKHIVPLKPKTPKTHKASTN